MLQKISPNPSCLPVRQGKDSQRGEFLAFARCDSACAASKRRGGGILSLMSIQLWTDYQFAPPQCVQLPRLVYIYAKTGM